MVCEDVEIGIAECCDDLFPGAAARRVVDDNLDIDAAIFCCDDSFGKDGMRPGEHRDLYRRRRRVDEIYYGGEGLFAIFWKGEILDILAADNMMT